MDTVTRKSSKTIIMDKNTAAKVKVKGPNIAQCARNFVKKKYIDGGWVVIDSPKGSITDLMASKANRLHYTQIVINKDDVRYKDLPKNEFIQNAFSNKAIPVHAIYTYTLVGSEVNNEKVVFTDINEGSTLIINRAPCKNTRNGAADPIESRESTNL